MHDDNLDERLRDAFDAMGPSPQAEARMLANVRAAGAARARARARSRRAWRIALPAAACLVLVAGVGALALNAMNMPLHSGSSANEAAIQNAADLSSVTSPEDPAGASAGGDASSESAGRVAEPPADAGATASSDGSAVAETPEGAAEGGDLTGGAEGDGDARYPFIALDTGEKARIALGDDGPLAAPDTAIGDELGGAQASSPVEEGTLACTAYASRDLKHAYVVRFNDTGQLYFADRIEE